MSFSKVLVLVMWLRVVQGDEEGLEDVSDFLGNFNLNVINDEVVHGFPFLIEFLPMIPLVIQEILAWLDNWLNLVHYMTCLQKQTENLAYIHGYLVA